MHNGELRNSSEPVLQANDLAVLRGYGIFDYFLFHHQRPFFLADYLNRFFHSAERFGLDLKWSPAEIEGMIFRLLQKNDSPEGSIRLVLTGGYSNDGFTPADPNFLILQAHRPQYPPTHYTEGVRLISQEFRREHPQVKSLNYLNGVLQQQRMRRAGATDVLYHDGTHVYETVRSNLFFVLPGREIVTPAEGVLLGVTRKQVLRLADEHYATTERPIGQAEILEAEECFLTSSNKRIMPVAQIDGRPIGDGRPGPVTRHLMEAFELYATQYLQDVARVGA